MIASRRPDEAALRGSIAILHDMVEEGWPSMDQMGALLTTRIPAWAPGLRPAAVRHAMRRVASRGPFRRVRHATLADRILNRMALYPQRVRREVAGQFDLYHVVDHSYAQLALVLPADATVVTCHDVDTFRCLIAGEAPKPAWFRMMTRRILEGLRRARVVICGSEAARDDLIRFELATPGQLVVVPNGIDPTFLREPSPRAAARARELLPPRAGTVDVLHVGSDAPRKRLDRLVDVVAALRDRGHAVRLVRAGGPVRGETRRRADHLRLDMVELPYLDTDVLRAIYGRCSVVLLTSDREGYGLTVLEAFAAGKPVVASDIPALRESSGGLATLVEPADVRGWTAAVEDVLRNVDQGARAAAERRARAASRTWDDHVRGLLPVYGELLERRRSRGR